MGCTCCACEKQVDERYFDTEKRMCDDCMLKEYNDIGDTNFYNYFGVDHFPNGEKTNLRKVMDKILRNIIKDLEIIFGELDKRDKKIIRENFKYKQSSWDSLGEGLRCVLERVITPLRMDVNQGEALSAIRKDMELITQSKKQQEERNG